MPLPYRVPSADTPPHYTEVRPHPDVQCASNTTFALRPAASSRGTSIDWWNSRGVCPERSSLRAAKAAWLGRTEIEAVQFDRDPEPDHVGVTLEELPY
jgi:hypothetical protein